ncbi:MAG: glycosyltransferase family 2 protein [Elainellaceae cyanobacterium]
MESINSSLDYPVSLDDVPLPRELPPLVLVAFTRPDLLNEVLSGISQQSLRPQRVIAFVDGPRKQNDETLINQCVSLLHEFSNTIPVNVVQRTHNLGRHPSGNLNIILGLEEVLSTYDSLVYLEDDIVPNPYFYDRMCRLLEAYRNHQEVFSVSAYASLPSELDTVIDADFIVSNRVFSWGFGIWSDRWHEIDLPNQPSQYNPFGSFYEIPATVQTKLTMVNQFWIEKNHQNDWVIALTLGALSKEKIHIIPTTSFVKNIGFGHPEAKTYTGQESSWVNARYDSSACLNRLPKSLELPTVLRSPLSGVKLAHHLSAHKGLWLNPAAMWYLIRRYRSLQSAMSLFALFSARIPIMLKRWRSRRPV